MTIRARNSFGIDEVPVDNKSCSLMGTTGLAVQGAMGVLVLLSLVYKRHRESTKRPWRIWLFDVSKQVIGQMFVHGVNVLISDIVSQYASENACVFYFLNILLDTTLGVAILYLILHVMAHFLVEKFNLEGFESGVYGEPPSFTYWIRQAAVYVFALTTMKTLVLVLLILFPGILHIGEWLLSWTWSPSGGDALQVIFTMGIFPIIMNIIQFWLIDSIVKAEGAQGVSLDREPLDPLDDEDREPLFQASDEEDDDAPPYDIENPRPPRPSSNRRSSQTRTRSPPRRKDSNEGHHTKKTSDDSVELHEYPPSLTHSTDSATSAESSSSPAKQPRPATKLNKLKRKDPPTPISVPSTGRPAAIASNSPWTASAEPEPTKVGASQQKAEPPAATQDGWENWDDDDWGERVGEEEWTGKRLTETKEAIEERWREPISS